MTNARLHLAAVTATASAAATLFALHPPTLGPFGALAPLVIAAAWLVATGVSAWLALTSAAALLAVVGAGRAPSCVARFAPSFVRRMVEVALVGSCIVGSAVPASATSWKTRRDVPVVRAPAAVTTTTTTTTPPPTNAHAAPATPAGAPSTPRATLPVTTTPVTTPHAPIATSNATHAHEERRAVGSRPSDPPARVAIPHASRRYTVQPGDNLWSIARAALGASADDAEVAPYWHALIASNRSRLRSGDPNLIYPGEVLGLPDRGANQ